MMSVEEPKVYIATYSSTDVYECQINDIPIMRRCRDDWVNATQILKCCNFPKAKRTKILEKGVQQGLHEKIQGGYGRFQGTWIPLEDAQRLAESYGVTAEIAPVLYLDLSDPNVVIPKKVKQLNKDGTPVKRKYTKKAKKLEDTPSKKIKTDIGPLQSFNALSRNPSHMSSFGSQQTPTRQFQQQMPYQMQQGQIPPTFSQPDFIGINGNMNGNITMNGNINGNMNGNINGNITSNMPINGNLDGSINGNVNGNINGMTSFGTQQQIVQNEFQNYQLQLQGMDQQKLYQPGLGYPQMQMQQPQMMNMNQPKTILSQSTNDTNWSHESTAPNRESDISLSSNDDMNLTNIKMTNVGNMPQSPHMEEEEDNSYSAQLLKFFSEDNSEIPYFIHNPPFDFNINEPIDDEGHTPLHWAASIGNCTMIHLLLSKGASPLMVNNFGLNPLSKLISFNNCFELKNFPKILEELELCLINTDINGRTPLHYLCQFAKVKSKYESLRYYLNVILNKLSSLSSQNPSKQIDLLKNVLDHQDVNGDTCLHLAAKAGSAKIAKVLLDYGARDNLENVNKETSKQIIAQYNLLPNHYAEQQRQFHQQQNQSQLHQVQQITPQPKLLQPPSSAPFQQPQAPQAPPQPKQQKQQDFTREQREGDREVQDQSYQNQILATPMQSRFVGESVETPDTQKTTVQDDDEDDDSVSRVNKEHIKNLMGNEDNKENIFMNGPLKNFDSASTPIGKNSNTANLHFPLAVISERTLESTPIKNTNQKLSQVVQQTYELNPPKLDKDGHLVESSEKENNKLLMNDLAHMISGMINSLSESYNKEMEKFNEEKKQLMTELAKKEHQNQRAIIRLKESIGIAEDDISMDQCKSLIVNKIEKHQQDLDEKQNTLLNILMKIETSKIDKLAKHNESEKYESHETENNCFESAVELTRLQLKRDTLLKDVTKSIGNYGIDPKMYKYRKLISLSCGLNLEDIDGLIDGIEESLMDTSVN